MSHSLDTMINITVLSPKSEFTQTQQARLAKLGQVNYVKKHIEYPLHKIIELAKNSNILAFEPDIVGGFENAPKKLRQLMTAMPKIKGLALDTSRFDYVDKKYCNEKEITVTHVPHCFTESVAEHTLSLLLGCAKRLFQTDRKTQKGKYQLNRGFELKGKTLGIIGLGHIGSRMAELGLAIGMKVIAWNRTPKRKKGVKIESLNNVLTQSDAISLHLTNCSKTRSFLSTKRIALLKKGVIIVNTSGRDLIDEKAMAKALESGKIDTYAFEADELDSPPLGSLENAVIFKGFGWFTKEALEKNKETWVKNIEGIVKGKSSVDKAF